MHVLLEAIVTSICWCINNIFTGFTIPCPQALKTGSFTFEEHGDITNDWCWITPSLGATTAPVTTTPVKQSISASSNSTCSTFYFIFITKHVSKSKTKVQMIQLHHKGIVKLSVTNVNVVPGWLWYHYQYQQVQKGWMPIHHRCTKQSMKEKNGLRKCKLTPKIAVIVPRRQKEQLEQVFLSLGFWLPPTATVAAPWAVMAAVMIALNGLAWSAASNWTSNEVEDVVNTWYDD